MDDIKIHDKVFTPYITHEEIQECVKDVAHRIYEDYKDETPVFIGVLNGVFMFFSDLLKHYPGKCEVAFLQMSSYAGTQSTGIVQKTMELTKDIKGRPIILVEDIVDTGHTLLALFEYFKNTQYPASVRIASLFLKPEAYRQDYQIDYIGKEIPNKFIVGYGLDYDELGRNLKDLYQIKD